MGRKPSLKGKTELGLLLIHHANENGMTLKELAVELGVSRQHISMIASGKIPPPPTTCFLIADYIGVPRSEILKLAGWLPDENDPDRIEFEAKLWRLLNSEPDFEKLLDLILEENDTKKRTTILKWILGGVENALSRS